MSAGETWDSNVLFEEPPGTESFVHRVGATLGFRNEGRRFSVDLSGRSRADFYDTQIRNDRLAYSVDAALTWRASARTELSLLHSESRRSSEEVPFLDDEGQVVPLTQARTRNTRAAVTRTIDASTSLSATARRVSVDFGDASLTDGSVLSADIRVSRVMGSADTLGMEYRWQRSDRADREGIGNTLNGFWGRSLGRRWRVQLALGVLRFESEVLAAARIRPSGSVTLDRQLRNGSLGLEFRRFLTQAFGVGSDRFTSLYSLTFTKRLMRRTVMTASTVFTSGSDPELTGPSFKTQLHGLSVSREIGRVTLEMRYRFERRRPVGGLAISRHTVRMGIRSAWRGR